MGACPTCGRSNCGNHAACERRAKKAEAAAAKKQIDLSEWSKEWEDQFRCIAEMEKILDTNARSDVPRDKAKALLLEVLEAHQLVEDVWSRIQTRALLDALENDDL